MSKKALLMILDGWGIGDQGKDDVIFNTPTPVSYTHLDTGFIRVFTDKHSCRKSHGEISAIEGNLHQCAIGDTHPDVYKRQP